MCMIISETKYINIFIRETSKTGRTGNVPNFSKPDARRAPESADEKKDVLSISAAVAKCLKCETSLDDTKCIAPVDCGALRYTTTRRAGGAAH